ncbi:MAG TPA: cupredoxin domain-containing protein [Ilumatobacteraceae bacterium]|nr:cupredoxin domain-containing protein [Ilumatobacteraceae bacterium]HUC32266.1 cupredoxin domain-containing protein [Ilumatobacteraceae bacterium]
MTIRHVLAGLTVSATLLLGACGDDDDNGDDSASTEAPSDSGEATGDAAVVIAGFAFTTSPASVGTITVRNDDTTAHTVTADDGSFDVRVNPGESGTIEVSEPGTYAFHCTIHPNMTGTLEVS